MIIFKKIVDIKCNKSWHSWRNSNKVRNINNIPVKLWFKHAQYKNYQINRKKYNKKATNQQHYILYVTQWRKKINKFGETSCVQPRPFYLFKVNFCKEIKNNSIFSTTDLFAIITYTYSEIRWRYFD